MILNLRQMVREHRTFVPHMAFSIPIRPSANKSLLSRLLQWARWVFRVLKALFLAYAVAFSIVGTILLCFGAWKTWRLYDSVAGLDDRLPDKTSFMEYREEQWEDSGKKVVVRWEPVALSSISKNLQNAVLVGEDDRFYQHNGFDLEAMQRAFVEGKSKGQWRRGGSTITQQLAKNLYLTPKRSMVRKAKEALYTMALEHFLSKDRILEIYLNVIEWGPGIYGIEAASRYYFGVHAAGLDLDQAARLAAVLPKPLKVRPDRDTKFMTFRKNAILQNLRQFKGIGVVAPKTDSDDDDDPAEASEPLPAEQTDTSTAPTLDAAEPPPATPIDTAR